MSKVRSSDTFLDTGCFTIVLFIISILKHSELITALDFTDVTLASKPDQKRTSVKEVN